MSKSWLMVFVMLTSGGALAQQPQPHNQHQYAGLWDGASPIARNWVAVRRQQVTGTGQMPAGNYANVEFSTSFETGKTDRELVSFHFGDDRAGGSSGIYLSKIPTVHEEFQVFGDTGV